MAADEREPQAPASEEDDLRLRDPRLAHGAIAAVAVQSAILAGLAYAVAGAALALGALLVGLAVALLLAGGLHRDDRGAEAQWRALAVVASRLGLREQPDDSFSGEFEGVRLEAAQADLGAEIRAKLRLGEPDPVWIVPRSVDPGGGQPTGSPMLDLVAAVDRAPPAALARLSAAANAEAVMQVLHGYPDWSISGERDVTITVRFRGHADEYTLEGALRAVAALARALEGEGGDAA